MVKECEQTISAYLDGELVAPAAVLEALNTEEGREALVEFVRLRVVTSVGAVPGEAFYARMREAAPPIGSRARRPVAWTIGVAVAASLVIGFLTGSSLASPAGTRSSGISALPPKSARVVEFQPGIDWHQVPSQQEVAREPQKP